MTLGFICDQLDYENAVYWDGEGSRSQGLVEPRSSPLEMLNLSCLFRKPSKSLEVSNRIYESGT